MAPERPLHPRGVAGLRRPLPNDRSMSPVGGDPPVPLRIDDAGPATPALAGRPPRERLVRCQHLEHRTGGPHQPRFGQLGQRVRELSRVRVRVAVGRPLQPGRIFRLLLRIVGPDDPRAGRGIVLAVLLGPDPRPARQDLRAAGGPRCPRHPPPRAFSAWRRAAGRPFPTAPPATRPGSGPAARARSAARSRAQARDSAGVSALGSAAGGVAGSAANSTRVRSSTTRSRGEARGSSRRRASASARAVRSSAARPGSISATVRSVAAASDEQEQIAHQRHRLAGPGRVCRAPPGPPGRARAAGSGRRHPATAPPRVVEAGESGARRWRRAHPRRSGAVARPASRASSVGAGGGSAGPIPGESGKSATTNSSRRRRNSSQARARIGAGPPGPELAARRAWRAAHLRR